MAEVVVAALSTLLKFFRQLINMGLAISAILVILLLVARLLITGALSCAPNCVGVNLLGRNLQGVNLQGTRLMEAQLQKVDLSGANLREVDLSGANLSQVNLRNADLTDARLIGANLSQARLEGSILSGADLSGAELSEADLTNVDLRATVVSGATFTKAKLTNVQLQGANLSGLDFSQAEMAGINLTNASLAGASLSRANLSGANLAGSDLLGAWLNLTNLVGANLAEADLSGSSLLGAVLAAANLQNSNLAGAVLVGAQLDGTNLRGANLQDAHVLATQLPPLSFQLDPVLQELNDLQRQALLHDTNFSGVAFDAKTVWAAGLSPLAAATVNNQLALALVASTVPTDSTTTATVASPLAEQAVVDISNLPTARRVMMNFFVNSIRNLRTETGEFRADLYLDLFWQEPTLPPDQPVAELGPKNLWDPQLSLVNSNNGYYLFTLYGASREPKTNVQLSYRAIGDFTAALDLHHFPFDQQRLPIILELGNSNSDAARLEFIDLNQPITTSEQAYRQEVPKGRYVDSAAVSDEWVLQSAQIVQQLYVYPYDQSSRARLQIELTLARRAAPYIWKYMVPLLLLALLAWSVCLVDTQALLKRLWLLAILLLTLVTFHASRWRTLPQVPDLTYLDVFLLLHYLLISSLMIGSVGIKFLHQGERTRAARWLNRGLGWGYPIFYTACNCLLYWQVWS